MPTFEFRISIVENVRSQNFIKNWLSEIQKFYRISLLLEWPTYYADNSHTLSIQSRCTSFYSHVLDWLDQSFGIYKFCCISGKGFHSHSNSLKARSHRQDNRSVFLVKFIGKKIVQLCKNIAEFIKKLQEFARNLQLCARKLQICARKLQILARNLPRCKRHICILYYIVFVTCMHLQIRLRHMIGKEEF